MVYSALQSIRFHTVSRYITPKIHRFLLIYIEVLFLLDVPQQSAQSFFLLVFFFCGISLKVQFSQIH